MSSRTHSCHGCSNLGLQRHMGCQLGAAQSYWDRVDEEERLAKALELLHDEQERLKAAARKGMETKRKKAEARFTEAFGMLVAQNLMHDHAPAAAPVPLLELVVEQTTQRGQYA